MTYSLKPLQNKQKITRDFCAMLLSLLLSLVACTSTSEPLQNSSVAKTIVTQPAITPNSVQAVTSQSQGTTTIWVGVLVERRFLQRHSLGIGDPLRLTLDVLGERVELTLTIVGALDYFPTLYSENGPFFVGNLGYLFTRLGGLYPYDVWLSTAPDSTAQIIAALGEHGVTVVATWDARARILEAQRQPQRQGLFGLLTLGFVASTLLTILGLALHALLTFRERTIELGVLRAIGLSVVRMRRYLLGTQLTLLGLGLGAGITLGLLTGLLFVPFLQVDAGLHPHTPPFIPQIAWAEVGWVVACFSATALCTLGVTLLLLRRMRLYEAIKLGQAV